MSHSSQRKEGATDSSSKSSSRRSGQVFLDDRKSVKPTVSSNDKQKPAYRRWDQSTPSATRSVQESSVEEQISRSNAIADIDIPEFIPQSFISKRIDNKDAKSLDGKDTSKKGPTGVLAGPVENLISPNLLPKTEEERNKLQAQILTALRRDLFQKRNNLQ